MLDLTRVFLATGSSCAVGSRHMVTWALGWLASKVPPSLGFDTWPQVLEAAERMGTSARAGTSRAYREAEVTRLLVGQVGDLLRSSGILLESDSCGLLNGADEEGAALQPGVGQGLRGGRSWRPRSRRSKSPVGRTLGGVFRLERTRLRREELVRVGPRSFSLRNHEARTIRSSSASRHPRTPQRYKCVCRFLSYTRFGWSGAAVPAGRKADNNNKLGAW